MDALSEHFSEIRAALLSNASDDFLGLWEAVPVARSVLNAPEAELLKTTKILLRNIVGGWRCGVCLGEPGPASRRSVDAGRNQPGS